MGAFNHSTASLRIYGNELVPEHITRLLGAMPTHIQTKGLPRADTQGRPTTYIARSGMWGLHASEQCPENLDQQIHEILGQLTNDLSVWKKIGENYEIDLFCGLFMQNSNDGMSLSPTSLLALGQRGIELELDIYDPTKD